MPCKQRDVYVRVAFLSYSQTEDASEGGKEGVKALLKISELEHIP